MNNIGNKTIINIYKYRCMTFNQLNNVIPAESKKIYNTLLDLIKYDYISYDSLSAINPEKSNDDYVEPENILYFSLTEKGHRYYKNELIFNKLTLRYDNVQAKHILDSNILGYDKYKMSHKMSKHQLHLVNFVINFSKYYNKKFKYSDEKEYKNKYNYLNTRPDATIETDDTIYLIEIDMSTESAQQLNKKFYNYIEIFKNSQKLYDKNKDIKILFINNTFERSNVVRHEALKELTLFLDESDFIIGTEFEIFNILFNNKFSIGNTVPFKEMIQNKTLQRTYDNNLNCDIFKYNGNIKIGNPTLLFLEYNYNLFTITFLEEVNLHNLPYSYIVLVNEKDDIFHFEKANDKYIFILKRDFEEYGLKSTRYIKKNEMLEEL